VFEGKAVKTKPGRIDPSEIIFPVFFKKVRRSMLN
jgi:hypothetical protein